MLMDSWLQVNTPWGPVSGWAWGAAGALLLLLGLLAMSLWRTARRRRMRRLLQPFFLPQEIALARRARLVPPWEGPPEASGENPFAWIIRSLTAPLPPETSRFLLLAPPGAGKSTFLLRLYFAFGPRRKGKHVRLLALPRLDLAELAAIPNPERCLLLLDGLDEDPAAPAHLRRRMDEILEASSRFFAVFISAREDMFPESFFHPKRRDRLNYTGEQFYQVFGLIRLRPWPEPMLAAAGMDANDAQFLKSGWPYLLNIREREVLRSPWSVHHWQHLFDSLHPAAEGRKALGEATLDMYRHLQHRGSWSLPREAAERLITRYGWKRIRQLTGLYPVLRQRQEQYRLPHSAAAEAWLAQLAYAEGWPPEATAFPYLPAARQFYAEITWLAYLRHTGQLAGEACLEGETHPRSMRSLPPEALGRISRLYLRQYRNTDLRLLRSLHRLRAIYLEGGRSSDFDAYLLRDLPHTEVFVLLTQQGEVKQALYLGHERGALTFADRSMPLEVRSPLPFLPESAPDVRRALPRRGASAQGSRALLRLLSPALLRKQADGGWPLALPPAETDAQICREYVLEEPALDLFTRMQIFTFENGERNLLLYNNYEPTLLIEITRNLVNRLAGIYGEDDYYRDRFDSDDEVQLREGFWTGRRWAWANTDSYAFPVSIYMTRPGAVKMAIFSLPPAHAMMAADEKMGIA